MTDNDSKPNQNQTEQQIRLVIVQEPPVSQVPPQTGNPEFREMFGVFRAQMEHEDTLVNHRIGFSTVVQGALITAFIFIHQAFPPVDNTKQAIEDSANTLLTLRITFCIVGIVLVFYALIGILAAISAWTKLSAKATEVLRLWDTWAKSTNQPLPIPELPYGGGSKVVHFFGTWFGPFAFVLFGVVWGILLWCLTR